MWTELFLLVPVVLDLRLLICQHSVVNKKPHWLTLVRQTSNRDDDKY